MPPTKKRLFDQVETKEQDEPAIMQQAPVTMKRAEIRHALHKALDVSIQNRGLTELHTHLMGMGSADFWVSTIIEKYLPRIEKYADSLPNGAVSKAKVTYSLEKLLKASGYFDGEADEFSSQLNRSLFEARFFEGFETRNFKSEHVAEQGCISNATIVTMLEEDDVRFGRLGPFRALVRNWFEFLGSDGLPAPHTEVLRTYRGNFNPAFYPQRFVMKDPIVDTRPEVLGMLLNSTCGRYASAGVLYIEYSVSAKDLLNPDKFEALNKKTFATRLCPAAKPEDEPKETIRRSLSKVPTLKAPVLPDMTPSTRGPHWRQFVEYVDKWPNQTVTFLAAFNRDKPGDLNYCVLTDAGEWTVREPPSPNSHPPPPPPTHRQAYAELATLTKNTLGVTALIGEVPGGPNEHDTMCIRLKALAAALCRDENITKVYPNLTGEKARIIELLHKVRPAGVDVDKYTQERQEYLALVVGLDWVGDELGHPFCPFSHDTFITAVAQWMNLNPRFGVRFHAGEGPIRPATDAPLDSSLRLAFYLHMYILTEGIMLYHRKMVDQLNSCDIQATVDSSSSSTGERQPGEQGRALPKPHIRIGHGVAFLWGCEKAAGERNQFDRDMESFRVFLRANEIVCELNPTSNHMLLPSTFQNGASNSNQRTLRSFLKEGLPVTLATDDDGIWTVNKCKRHCNHISVAAEYCQAIESDDILSMAELTEMLWWGRYSAFSALTEADKKMPAEVQERRSKIVDAEGFRIDANQVRLYQAP